MKSSQRSSLSKCLPFKQKKQKNFPLHLLDLHFLVLFSMEDTAPSTDLPGGRFTNPKTAILQGAAPVISSVTAFPEIQDDGAVNGLGWTWYIHPRKPNMFAPENMDGWKTTDYFPCGVW